MNRTSSTAAAVALDQMNSTFKAITGRDAYLYTSRPGDGTARYVFTDAVKLGATAALAHMSKLLDDARQATLPSHSDSW